MALPLRLLDSQNSACSAVSWRRLQRPLAKLPFEAIAPISILFQPSLTAHRGELLVGTSRGTPVHAASFLRQRRIVLETCLLTDQPALRFIVIHELLHFVWARLGNPRRREYSAVLESETAVGEAGDSSNVAKMRWQSRPQSSALWKNYVCESFCDTGAALLLTIIGPVLFRLCGSIVAVSGLREPNRAGGGAVETLH